MKRDGYDLLSGMIKNIRDHSQLYSTHKFVETVISIEYVERQYQGRVDISKAELRQLSGISAETSRVVNKLLAESGRWEVIPGAGRVRTTYKPLFLQAVLDQMGKGGE